MPVFDIHAELGAMADAFAAHSIEYAVCGALALAVHGKPRATKDIDIIVEPSCVDRAKTVLRALGYDVLAAPMTFQSGVTVHRISRVESRELLTVDLIAASGRSKMQSETDSKSIGETGHCGSCPATHSLQ